MQIHLKPAHIKQKIANFLCEFRHKTRFTLVKKKQSFSRCNTISTFLPPVQLDVHLITSGQDFGLGFSSCGLSDLRRLA